MAYGGTNFQLLGEGGELAGITWTLKTNSIGISGVNRIIYEKGMFIMVGNNSSWNGILATSVNGIDWTLRTTNVTSAMAGIVYGDGLFVAGGYGNGKLITSTDGINWTPRTISYPSDIYDIAYGKGLFVLVGYYNESTQGKLETSPDGINWTARTSNFGTSDIGAIGYGDGKFIIGGNSKLAISENIY